MLGNALAYALRFARLASGEPVSFVRKTWSRATMSRIAISGTGLCNGKKFRL